jgi:hypothetical protein
LSRDHLRLIFHAAIVLFVGLTCGLPTVLEEAPNASRHWHTAHEALIMMGVWMLATAGVMPVLSLERREMAALRWSMLGVGYGFMVTLLIQGVTGYPSFEPGASPIRIVEFAGSIVGILGAVMTALITLRGAKAALDGRAKD